MLYNKINLSSAYRNCSINDPNYAFSLHSYIVKEDNQSIMYIELDSFFKYVGIKDIDNIISKIKEIKTAKLVKKKILFNSKNFIYYKHLNPAIAIAHFELRKSNKDNNALKESLEYLSPAITKSWQNEKDRIISLLDF